MECELRFHSEHRIEKYLKTGMRSTGVSEFAGPRIDLEAVSEPNEFMSTGHA
jgi:hypothetical protein